MAIQQETTEFSTCAFCEAVAQVGEAAQRDGAQCSAPTKGAAGRVPRRKRVSRFTVTETSHTVFTVRCGPEPDDTSTKKSLFSSLNSWVARCVGHMAWLMGACVVCAKAYPGVCCRVAREVHASRVDSSVPTPDTDTDHLFVYTSTVLCIVARQPRANRRSFGGAAVETGAGCRIAKTTSDGRDHWRWCCGQCGAEAGQDHRRWCCEAEHWAAEAWAWAFVAARFPPRALGA